MTDLRIIPSIEELCGRETARALEGEFGRAAILRALRGAAGQLRSALEARNAPGGPPLIADRLAAAVFIEERAVALLRAACQPSLRPVVNATGVIVHTNLGRAPLCDAAVARLCEVAPSYSNLEFDLGVGGRGRRDVHAEALLCLVVGAEAAVVVNNNAAAMLLLLAALAAGREVVVSRGELVEIGGGFRIPDVMAQSGARLREVGTTNRTRVDDYRAAIGPDTALLLRVHRSNFRIEGFTERPTLEALVALGHERSIPVAEDIGSGFVGLPGEEDGTRLGALLGHEPLVQASLGAGVDVACFSGDKLLGGPQAGIIVGRRTLVDLTRRHPLMRAVRAGKLTYAALEGTLAEYAAGRASRTIPVARMILLPPGAIEARARAVIEQAGPATGLVVAVLDGHSTVGGGSTPGLEVPTRLIGLRHPARSADWLDEHLRRQVPAVVGRIVDDRVVLDLRTVLPSQDPAVATALRTLGTAAG
jgi:L-seryl-tRNA(Ser) seleniumtransferase